MYALVFAAAAMGSPPSDPGSTSSTSEVAKQAVPAPEVKSAPVRLELDEAPLSLRPAPEPRTGRGWLIGSGVLGGLAWAATATQIALADGCGAQIRAGEIGNAPYDCGMRGQRSMALFGLQAAKATANFGSWLSAAGGGTARGRYEAVEVARAQRRPRAAGSWVFHGFALSAAAMAGIGAASFYVSRPCRGGDCTNELRTYFVMQQVSQTAFSAGLGMMAFGFSYNGERRRHLDVLRRARSVRVAPQLSPAGGGASIAGRF